jgi:hypothetical protein
MDRNRIWDRGRGRIRDSDRYTIGIEIGTRRESSCSKAPCLHRVRIGGRIRDREGICRSSVRDRGNYG